MASEAEVRTEVARQAGAGADFIKLYAHLAAELASTAIDEAHRLGLKAIGHLGIKSWKEAVECGIDMLLT